MIVLPNESCFKCYVSCKTTNLLYNSVSTKLHLILWLSNVCFGIVLLDMLNEIFTSTNLMSVMLYLACFLGFDWSLVYSYLSLDWILVYSQLNLGWIWFIHTGSWIYSEFWFIHSWVKIWFRFTHKWISTEFLYTHHCLFILDFWIIHSWV